jgi:hypothetical protein
VESNHRFSFAQFDSDVHLVFFPTLPALTWLLSLLRLGIHPCSVFTQRRILVSKSICVVSTHRMDFASCGVDSAGVWSKGLSKNNLNTLKYDNLVLKKINQDKYNEEEKQAKNS